jgi:type I site-specific restriction endonuclease
MLPIAIIEARITRNLLDQEYSKPWNIRNNTNPFVFTSNGDSFIFMTKQMKLELEKKSH